MTPPALTDSQRFAVHAEVDGTRRRRTDVGDRLCRLYGWWVTSTKCGMEVATVRATRRTDRVTCPNCKTAIWSAVMTTWLPGTAAADAR